MRLTTKAQALVLLAVSHGSTPTLANRSSVNCRSTTTHVRAGTSACALMKTWLFAVRHGHGAVHLQASTLRETVCRCPAPESSAAHRSGNIIRCVPEDIDACPRGYTCQRAPNKEYLCCTPPMRCELVFFLLKPLSTFRSTWHEPAA